MNGVFNVESIQPCFDASSSKLAWGSVDGRVKLFDVSSGCIVSDITKELSSGSIKEGDISQSVYSSLIWGQKVRRWKTFPCMLHANFLGTHFSAQTVDCFSQGALTKILVAGSVDGSVIAYDTARMKLLWRRTMPYGSVSSMVMVETNVLIMTGSGRAVILDMKNGNELAQWTSPSKFQVSKMASLQDGRVLLGGSAVVLVDSTTGARIGKWTGHATPIVDLDCDEQFFCSAATGDRTIAMWSTKKKSAVAQASLNHPVTQVCLARATGRHNRKVTADSVFHMVAVTLSGDIHVFKYLPDDQVVEWAASGSGGLPVVQVSIDSASEDGLELTVVYGSIVKPKFSKLKLSVSKDGSIVHIPKPDAQGEDGLLKSIKGEKRKGASSHIPLAVAETNENTILHGTLKGMDVDGDDVPSMSEDDDIEDDQERNLTFAERLANLKGTSLPSDEFSRPVESSEFNKIPPKADSLAVLLSQAIANEDNALLERCLSVKNPKTVSKTALHLTPGDATTLVNMLVQKLQSSPRRAAELCAWVKAILVHHAGYFAGTGACKESFSNLHQIIDARLSCYGSLVSLNGRLDLVLACARQNAAMDERYGAGIGGTGRPLVTATIDDEGNFDVQDAATAIGLEGESDGDSDGSDSSEIGEEESDSSELSD
jgi:U3 small nucleolar RNA-associated protein 5